MTSLPRTALTGALVTTLPACFAMRSSKGGGQAEFRPPRRAEPQWVPRPAGYRIEVAATGLSLPTGVARCSSHEIRDDQLEAVTAYMVWLRKRPHR